MSYNKETGMYEGYIYKITNDINNKIYIGQTKRDVKTRWAEHIYQSKNDTTIIHKAMNKYGVDNFNIYELIKLESDNKNELENILNKKEQEYIKEFKTQTPNGYNIVEGGKSFINPNLFSPIDMYDYNGSKIAQFASLSEAVEKTKISKGNIISQCTTHIPKKNIRLLFRYKDDELTEEELENAKKYNPDIYQYDISGKLLNTFDSINSVINYLSTLNIVANSRNISNACNINSHFLSAYGFIWRKYPYKFEDKKLPHLIKKRNIKRIEQRDLETFNIINVFNTLSDIKNVYPDFNTDNIQKVCKDIENQSYTHLTSYNYSWCYEDTFNEILKNKIINRSKKKSVNQYSLDGKLIRHFESITEAAKSIKENASVSFIKYCCEGKLQTAYNYKWQYC